VAGKNIYLGSPNDDKCLRWQPALLGTSNLIRRINMNTFTSAGVYVGTYGKYNNGSIAGKWLYFKNFDTAADFWKACKALHKDEADPEYMFQDYEGFPASWYSESGMDIDKLITYAHMDEDDQEMVDEYLEATGDDRDLEDMRDRYITTLTEFNREREYGYFVAEDMAGIEIPENIAPYFDYEAYGRDMLMDCAVSENGFVFDTSY
jgi:antirestriction protein